MSIAPLVLDDTGRLPAELLLHLLDFMSEIDICRFARLSRRLRAVATTHPRCFILVKLLSDIRRYGDSALYKPRRIVTHAVKHGMPLSLILDYWPDPPNHDFEEVYAAYIQEKIFEIVRLALPVTIRISIYITVNHWAKVQDLLYQPMPLLRRFDIYADCYGRSPEKPISVPHDVFRGVAPRLTQVALSYVALENTPTIAFHGVRRVVINGPVKSFTISSHFPSVRFLELSDWFTHGDTVPPMDCRNLDLWLFIVEAKSPEVVPYLRTQLDLRSIPSLVYSGLDDEKTDGKRWESLGPGPLALHADEYITRRKKCWVISLKSVGRANTQPTRTVQELWSDLVGVGTLTTAIAIRLVDVRVAASAALDLARKCDELPSLLSLRIDVIYKWGFVPYPVPADADDTLSHHFSIPASVMVSCPQLKVIKLCALDLPRVVRAHTIANVGMAFGQRERGCESASEVVLVGVRYNDFDSSILTEVFPRISIHKFTPMISPDEQDLLPIVLRLHE